MSARGGAPGRHPLWSWLLRALTLAFFVALILLLASRAKAIDWAQVGVVLRGYEAATLLIAAVAAAASYAVYSSFDLFGRWYTGHALTRRQVMSTAFVSYAFNLNLGALIGGVAFRYRLYTRQGLSAGTITRVLGLSVATNWLGYLALGGALFAAGVLDLPDQWKLGDGALRVLGAVLIAASLAYIGFCAFSPWREASLRGISLPLPSARVALLQLAVSTLNWLLIGAVVYSLLEAALPYHTVLAVLLVAAIAGVVTHVPAGLGVVEAVFLGLLGGQVDEARLLAALLAYRAIYYLVPLSLAVLLFLRVEVRGRRSALA